MAKFSEQEKEMLLNKFKEMLDSGNEYEVYETVDIPEMSLDPFLVGKTWPEPYKRTIHTITIRTFEG